jgi:hypothetical protein
MTFETPQTTRLKPAELTVRVVYLEMEMVAAVQQGK